MLTLIKSSFIEYKLTILRNKKTQNALFRQTMNEISYLIAAEVLKNLKSEWKDRLEIELASLCPLDLLNIEGGKIAKIVKNNLKIFIGKKILKRY